MTESCHFQWSFLHFVVNFYKLRWDTAISDFTLQKADLLEKICWKFCEFSIFPTLVSTLVILEKIAQKLFVWSLFLIFVAIINA